MKPHTPHILVVDDHRDIRDAVARFLQKNGMRASTATDAADMDEKLAVGRFDLIVLDVMMPGEDGLSACRRLSSAGSAPIIMLTALGDDTDRIIGLEVGADDYLPKPFNPRELLARIKAVLRRSNQAQTLAGQLSGAMVRFAHWTLNVDQRILKPDTGPEEKLSSSEFRLLVALLERPRIVLSREELLDLTAGRSAGPFDRTIDNQVSRLRRKIESDPLRPKIITTVRNGGYSLATDVDILS